MKTRIVWLVFGLVAVCMVGWVWAQSPQTKEEGRTIMSGSFKKLSPEEERVILHKGTEAPFSGEFVHSHEKGEYRCKRCGAALFPSGAKFDSHCGWPSFDDAEPGALREIPDADGERREIVCAACGAHLGHVFRGEGFTAKNTRHCVNSISLSFAPQTAATATAYFAGGCFWGVEYYFEQAPGVIRAESGYMGGKVANPSYEDVKTGRSGHAETVRVVFDPARTRYEQLARLFFEIHDPTQVDHQGPDFGEQYRSVVFYADEAQRATAAALMATLKARGYAVATTLVPAGTFYKAEDYHQDYYHLKGTTPYCHARSNRFGNDE